MQQVLIYIHGFMSSPKSLKAKVTTEYIRQHYPQLTIEVPQLPNYPKEAIKVLETLVEDHAHKRLCFIGSSLGGYFATYLIEKYGGRAVLINPAVAPHTLLADYLGEHVNPYTDQHFTLEQQHVEELRTLDTNGLTQQRAIWALLQTGDETLDYTHAQQKYRECNLTIEQGGDHAFQGYDKHLHQILSFLLAQ